MYSDGKKSKRSEKIWSDKYQDIDHFNLLRPIYRQTATYGHYGRKDFPWEALDKCDVLR